MYRLALYAQRGGSSRRCFRSNPHFRGRHHRFLSGLGALHTAYQGWSTSCPVGFHRTQETLRLYGSSGLLFVMKFLDFGLGEVL